MLANLGRRFGVLPNWEQDIVLPDGSGYRLGAGLSRPASNVSSVLGNDVMPVSAWLESRQFSAGISLTSVTGNPI